jgi:hypothetical protein
MSSKGSKRPVRTAGSTSVVRAWYYRKFGFLPAFCLYFLYGSTVVPVVRKKTEITKLIRKKVTRANRSFLYILPYYRTTVTKGYIKCRQILKFTVVRTAYYPYYREEWGFIDALGLGLL